MQNVIFLMISSLERLEFWINLAAKGAGVLAILVPLGGFWRSSSRRRGQISGWASLTTFPVVGVIAILYVILGVLLWRPLPLIMSGLLRLASLLIGSLLYFPGIALYLWAYTTLGKMYAPSSAFGASVYADHRLVQEGPYAFIRHPMYLGVIVVAAGALLLFKTWAMILYAFSSLVVIFRARQEDRLLSDRFGEEWEAYGSRVPGWVPRRANTDSAI